VLVRNPYYPEQVSRYRLDPEVVDCLCFCTKNPAPMLARLGELDGFRQFWFVTMTPYGKEIEPNVPATEEVMASFRSLSEKVGLASVSWRYDPIFLTEKYNLDFHINVFQEMAEQLEGYVDSCVISFIDLYAKTRRNFPQARRVTGEERAAIGEAFARIGAAHGIAIRSCCEGTDLVRFGVDAGGCMTQPVIERAIGTTLAIPKNRKSPREACNCLIGNDIGMYNTCAHGCVYCYANYDRKSVQESLARHDPDSPFLIGAARADDIVREAPQKSYIDGQMSLFKY
jgi:hypothetical protein